MAASRRRSAPATWYGFALMSVTGTVQDATATWFIRRLRSGRRCGKKRSPKRCTRTRWAEAMTAPLTQRQQQAKDAFTLVHGTWSDGWDSLLRLDASFFEAYVAFSSVPSKKNHLEDKVKAFVAITACAAATHLYRSEERRVGKECR